MVDHEKIRAVSSDVYNHFYLTIKEMDGTRWNEIDTLTKEYDAKHNGDEFARDLIRAYVFEWCRCNMEGGLGMSLNQNLDTSAIKEELRCREKQ
jgi:hypothetical protein